jgi:hypothetical protein
MLLAVSSANISKLFKRFSPARLGLLVAAVLILPLVGFTGSANAATSDCGPNRLCIWAGFNGGGARYEWGGNWHDTCANFIPSWYDRASSMWNRLGNGERVQFYSQTGCTGIVVSIVYWPSSNAYNFAWPDNDEFRSVKFF